MDSERAGGSAPTIDSPSLADTIGSMFGDFIPEAPAESSDTDAGAPPVSERAEDVAPPSDSSEGFDADAERAGAPPADAAIAEPDAQAPVIDDDPLKDAAPFGYTVNGQSRTADGIKVLKDGESVVGAVVDAEFLPKLERVFTERDHLFEQQQAQHQRYSDLERLTTWHTKDAQGNDRTLTGRDALEAQRTLTARAVATLKVLNEAFQNPESFAQLVEHRLSDPNNPDSPILVVPSAQGLKYLRTMAENEAIKAENSVRSHFATLSAPKPEPVAAPSPADHAAPTITAIEQQHGITGLTDEDRAFLTAEFERYVHTTKDGMTVHPRFVDVMKDRAAMRAQLSKVAQSAGDAGKQNAAKLAAAAQGKRPAGTRPKQPVTLPRQPDQRTEDANNAWLIHERASANAMRHTSRA